MALQKIPRDQIRQWWAEQDRAVEAAFKAMKGKRSRRTIDRAGSGPCVAQLAPMADEWTQVRHLQWEALELHREIVWKMRRALIESEIRLADREREFASGNESE